MPLSTSPLSRPRIDVFQLRTGALFNWRSNELGLASIRGDQTPTFSRASRASARGTNGGLRMLPIGVERFHMVDLDNDGVYETPVLLLEPARTNGATAPEQLSNVAYVVTEADHVSNENVFTAPDGSLTADKLTETAVTSTHSVHQNITGATDNTASTFSVFVRAAERSWIAVETLSKANVTVRSYINVSTGALGTIGHTNAVRVEKWGNNWYRVIVGYNVGTGATTPRFTVQLATANGTNNYLGVVGSGVHLWGWSAEVNASFSAGTYTNPSAVDDVLTWAYDGRPQAMTVYVRGIELGTIVQNVGLLDIGGNAGAAPRLRIIAIAGMYWATLHKNESDAVSRSLTVAPTVDQQVELRVEVAASPTTQGNVTLRLGQSINGGAEVLTAASTELTLPLAWAAPLITVNQESGGARGRFGFRDISIWPGARSLAELRGLV